MSIFRDEAKRELDAYLDEKQAYYFEEDGDDDAGLLVRYAKKHPIGTAIIVLVTLALAILLINAGLNASSLPDYSQVETDAYTRIVVPPYTAGDWGPDDHLALTSLDVVSRSRSSSAPEGADLSVTFGATAYATADVIAHYSSEHIEATKSTSLGYARQHDNWVAAGDEQATAIAYTTLGGVDEQKVLAAALNILELAEATSTTQQTAAITNANSSLVEEQSLVELYKTGDISIKGSYFDADAQTDTLALRYVKREGFSSYECEVTCTFVFHAINGVWELADTQLSDGATTRTYTPIIGTWQGTFQTQRTQGTKCLGANAAPFSVAIRSYASDTTGTRVVARISGVAHYHEHPEQDEDSNAGDLVFSDVEIPLVLQTTTSSLIRGNVVFQGSLPETRGGVVTVAVAFGTSEDPEAVSAVVRTEHTYDDSFIGIPIERQASWDDSYLLIRNN